MAGWVVGQIKGQFQPVWHFLSRTTDVLVVDAGPTGLTLACVLANDGIALLLVDRIAEGADTRRLADDERLWRPIAQRVVNFTDRMTRTATLRRPRVRLMRNATIRVVGRIPAVRRQLAFELAELRNR